MLGSLQIKTCIFPMKVELSVDVSIEISHNIQGFIQKPGQIYAPTCASVLMSQVHVANTTCVSHAERKPTSNYFHWCYDGARGRPCMVRTPKGQCEFNGIVHIIVLMWIISCSALLNHRRLCYSCLDQPPLQCGLETTFLMNFCCNLEFSTTPT